MKKIFSLLLLLITSLRLCAQEQKTIQLKQQKITYHPRDFHVSAIVDDRPDTTNIGIGNFGSRGKKTKLILQGGLAGALSGYLHNNLVQDDKTTAITLHISQLDVSEKEISANARQVDVSLTISFYQGDRKLVEYSGSGYQQAQGDASVYIEKLLRSRIENCIIEFDKWWADNKTGADGKASVSVTAVIIHTSDDAEQIPYSKNRLLTLADFQGPVEDISQAAAATYSGIAVSYNAEGQNNRINVHVNIAPYFQKDKSWCRSNSRDAKTLGHEQLHFDITAIKACELLTTIQQHTFTENYAQEINQLRKQNEKEWQQMQDYYDRETTHGTIPLQQHKWEEKIKTQLAEQSCY